MIYRRGEHSGVWYVRIKIDGMDSHLVRSAKTKDEAEARLKAKALLHECIVKIHSKQPIKDKKFADYWEDWYLQESIFRGWTPDRKKWHRGQYERYFKRYFGNYYLNALTTQVVDGYWQWRLNFWESEEGKKIRLNNPKRKGAKTATTLNARPRPATKTLKMEQSAINQVLAAAYRAQLISHQVELISPPRRAGETGRRPHFDSNELKALVRGLRDWAFCVGIFKDDTINAYQKHRRKQLYSYVVFLAMSGLRTGEANRLRWEDITHHETEMGTHTSIYVRKVGKTGARTVIPMQEIAKILEDWTKEVGPVGPQELVWRGQRGPDGVKDKAVTDLNKTFQTVLKRIPYKGRSKGLLNDADGCKRSLYSLRHTYATYMLLTDSASMMALAKNMGTSYTYIDKHYGHLTALDFTRQFAAASLPGLEPWTVELATRGGTDTGEDQASAAAYYTTARMNLDLLRQLLALDGEGEHQRPRSPKSSKP